MILPRLPFAALAAALLTLDQWAQIIGLLIVVVGIVVVTPSRRSMAVWKGEAEGSRARADRLQEELLGAGTRANDEAARRAECEREIAHLGGQLKTMERYTAQGAIETMAERLATMQAALVTAVQGGSDLTLQTHAILEEHNRQLQKNRAVLERLEKRLAPTE